MLALTKRQNMILKALALTGSLIVAAQIAPGKIDLRTATHGWSAPSFLSPAMRAR